MALKEKIEVLPDGKILAPKTLTKKPGRKTDQERRNLGQTNSRRGGKVGRVWFDDKTKMEVACAFAVTGNARRASELTGVPEGTIRSWKTQEWWHEIQSRIIQEQDEELDVKLTKLVDKAVDQVNDRLDNGDFIYNAKEDKLVRKPVGAKDLAIVTAITVDKRQLLRGQPTQRVEKVSTDERLNKLALEFKKFSNAKEITHEEIEDTEAFAQEAQQGHEEAKTDKDLLSA